MPKKKNRYAEQLEKWNIVVPPTEQSAKSLVNFILQGNGSFGENQFVRCEIVRNAQSCWIGKRVLAHYMKTGLARPMKTGIVLYFRAKWKIEVRWQKAVDKTMGRPPVQFVFPFVARFKPDGDGQSTEVFLDNLKILD